MAKLPRRKCAHKACRQWFHPVRDGQVVCSFECASAIGKEQTSKAREAAQQKEAQRQRTEERQAASAVKRDWQNSGLTVTTKPGLSKLSTPSSVRAMPICHASAVVRLILPICMAASGTAATSKQSVLTLNCALKSATPISSASRVMPEPESTPPKRRRSRSNTKLARSLVTGRITSTGSMAPRND